VSATHSTASTAGESTAALGFEPGLLPDDWEMVIGLEVHAELATKTKMFSPAPNEFGGDPNTLAGNVARALCLDRTKAWKWERMRVARPLLGALELEQRVEGGLGVGRRVTAQVLGEFLGRLGLE